MKATLLFSKLPSSAEEGWLRHQENDAKPPLKGADGVVLIKKTISLTNTTPALRATPPQLRRGVRFLATLSLLIAVFGPTLYAQELTAVDVKSNRPTPRTADGHPDLSGYWKGTRDTRPVGNIGKDLPGYKLPLTPAGQAALQHNLTATIDPESLCIIGGIPRHNASGLPFEVLQGRNKVAFLYWYSYYRLIPINANRKHSDDPEPSFFGEELGRWEGDTLVIDSVGFKDEQVWIDENANPHSDTLHVVERWTRPDADHIHVETLIEDPKFYTRPFNYSRTWVLGKPDEEIQEYSCSENNVDREHLGFGPGPIRPDGTRGYIDPAPLPPPVKKN